MNVIATYAGFPISETRSRCTCGHLAEPHEPHTSWNAGVRSDQYCHQCAGSDNQTLMLSRGHTWDGDGVIKETPGIPLHKLLDWIGKPNPADTLWVDWDEWESDGAPKRWHRYDKYWRKPFLHERGKVT